MELPARRRSELSQVIQIDEGKIQEHLGKWFAARWKRRYAMLDGEADRLCRAERYERTARRVK